MNDAEVLDQIATMCANKDTGREGCTYNDTEHDSISVVYGYNLALEYIENLLKKRNNA